MKRSSSTQADTAQHRLRVLVVEDHGPSAASFEEFLRLLGHDVGVATNGLRAMQAIQADKPDVVLLDIGLPGDMDGYAIAKWIGEQTTDKRPLVVAVTGLDGEEDRRNSERSGIDLHLVKPVDASKLQGLLARFKQVVAP
jgi:CheY-like chemotaxis protein